MSKELWIASYEALVAQYIDEGMTEAEAEKKAEDRAHSHMIDRLADHADYLRKIAKGE